MRFLPKLGEKKRQRLLFQESKKVHFIGVLREPPFMFYHIDIGPKTILGTITVASGLGLTACLTDQQLPPRAGGPATSQLHI